MFCMVAMMNESDGNKTESIGESASSISQRLDLNHGFVRHIRHLQQKRDKIEKEWQQEQQPEKVAQRIKERMPTSQQLRRQRQQQHAKSGPSPNFAARTFGGIFNQNASRLQRKEKMAADSSTRKIQQHQEMASLDSNTLASATSTTQAQEINPTSNSDNATASCNINSRPEASHTYRNPGAKCITEQHNLESAAGNESKQNKHYGEFDDYEENATPVRCPIFRVEVELNHEIECIILYEGDHIPAVVREFGLEHHLTDEQIEVLADHVTREYQNALL